MSPQVGVEVLDVDVMTMLDDEWAFHQLKRALEEHLVVLARGQELGPDTLVRFAQLFGPAMDVRQVGNGAVHVPGTDLIKVVSNARDEQGRRLGDGNAAGQIWHVDASYWEAPPGTTVFYARQVPPDAPQTMFIDMRRVYASLPDPLKERIRDLRVQHHQYPRGVEEGVHRDGPSLPRDKRQIGAVHPLVRRHLGTHQPILFLPFRRDCLIPGLSDEESEDLLTQLWDIAAQSPARCAVTLEPDDLIIWDNAASVHRREAWPEDQARVIWQVLVFGEVPTPMYPPKVTNINALGYSGTGDEGYVTGTAMADY